MHNLSNQSVPMTTSANGDDDQVVSHNLKISLSVIILLCSVIANLLVITIVLSNAHMRTSFNYLIVNMSVSDLFVPFVAIPLYLNDDLNSGRWFVDGRFGDILCKLSYFLIDLAPVVSVCSLVIIAVNRFVAIVLPMHVNAFNKKATSRLLIIVPWVLGMAFFSHLFYAVRLSDGQCTYSWDPTFDNMAALRVVVIITLVLFVVIPFLSISVMYSIIIYKIRQSSENVSSMIQDNRSRKYRDRQIFYLSLVIIVAFGLLWCPVLIYQTLQIYLLLDSQVIDFVLYIMLWSATVVNPLICILFNGKFRQGFRRLCCKKYWKSKRVTIQSRPTRTTKQSKDDSSTRSISVDRFQVITAI